MIHSENEKVPFIYLVYPVLDSRIIFVCKALVQLSRIAGFFQDINV